MDKKIDEKKLLSLMDNEFRNVFLSLRGRFKKVNDTRHIQSRYSQILFYNYEDIAYETYKKMTIPIKNRLLIRFLKEYYPSKYSLLRTWDLSGLREKGIKEYDFVAVSPHFIAKYFKDIFEDSRY